MATEIRVPTLGESVTEATIGKWFKKVGDTVAVDEPLVELETDKVTVEVPSPAAGVLADITAKDGETVGVGALLGNIDAGAGAKPAKKGEGSSPATKPEAIAQAAGSAGASTVRQAEVKTAKVAGEGPVEERKMPPAPAAAKLLAESNIAVDQVQGSGKRGQVLKGDVLDAHRQGRTLAAARDAEGCCPRAVRPQRRGARRTRADDQTAPDHCSPPEGSAVDGCDAHHLQRGGHERRSWRSARNTRMCSRRSTA